MKAVHRHTKNVRRFCHLQPGVKHFVYHFFHPVILHFGKLPRLPLSFILQQICRTFFIDLYMPVLQVMPQLPYPVFPQVILIAGLPVLIKYRGGNKASVIIDIAAADLSFLIQCDPYGISILPEIDLRIFLSLQHGSHRKG